MAKCCHIGRVKASLPTIFDHYGIDPFIKNKDQLTAREVANCLFEQTGKPYCEYMAEELELYEKRYQEIMQQKRVWNFPDPFLFVQSNFNNFLVW